MSLVGLGQIQTIDIKITSEKPPEPSTDVLNKDQSGPTTSLNPSAPEFVPGAATGRTTLTEKGIQVSNKTNNVGTNNFEEDRNEHLRPPKLLHQKGKSL